MLNSGLYRLVARPQSVCNTCAADGRELQAIRSVPHFLGVCDILPLSKNYMICFECRAVLHKFIRFRHRAKWVKAMLERTSYNVYNTKHNPKIQCLSTLTQTVISPNDTIYIDGDSVQVKQEIPDLLSDSTGTIDKIPLLSSPDGKLEQVADNMPLYQAYLTDVDKRHFITEAKETKDVPEPLVDVKEVKEELEEVNNETYLGPVLDLKAGKREGFEMTKKDAMAENNRMIDEDNANEDDDSETDTASEMSNDPQKEASEQFYTVTQMDLAEVLSLMERERGSERYKFARYKCEQCALVLRTEQFHRAHIQLHSPTRGRVMCVVCQQRFPTRKEAQTHVAMHYCRFECSHCSHIEYSLQRIEYHFLREHDTTPRYCNQCNERFTRYDDYRKHRRTAHTGAPAHACDSCDRRYPTALLLQRHMRMSHTKVPGLECEICHRKYKGDINLQKHIRSIHERAKPNDENAYCAECDKQYRDINSYKIHLRSSVKHAQRASDRFECDYCGKRCNVKGSLRSHIELIHMKIARYKCDVCEESFPTASYLRRHKQKHAPVARVKRYVCRVCEKAFTVRKSLDQHMNTHLGRRPFKCKLCEATFAYSAALYNHNQLVHLKRKVGKARNT